MHLRFLFFFIFYSWFTVFPAKSQYTFEDFLGTAKQDLSLEATRAKLDFLRNNNFNGPWISRLEFRFGSRDADWSQEDFRLRITPANPGELKAWKRYYDDQRALLNLEYKDNLNRALKRRYSLAIDHISESVKKEVLENHLLKNKQVIELINAGGGAYRLEISDLIDAQRDELKISLDIQNSNIRIDELDFYIRDMFKNTGEVDWSAVEIISIEDVLLLFEELKLKPDGRHINLANMEQRHALAAGRFNIEKSESLRNIGFFQANYNTNRGEGFSDHFGYQIGIRIPIVNPDKPDLNRRKLATMGHDAEMEAREDEYRRRKEFSELLMTRYQAQYNEIKEKLSFVANQNILQFQRQDKAPGIRDLIKLNEFQISLLIKKNDIEMAIYENYMEYLDLCGMIAETPLKNYLSKNLTEF